jgi:hypothetical protein
MKAPWAVWDKIGSAAIVFLITIFIAFSAVDLLAQGAKKEAKKDVKVKTEKKQDLKSEVKKDQEKESGAMSKEETGPVRLGIFPIALIPLGSLSGAMSTGLGGMVFCDYRLPFNYDRLVMRAGADAGFIYASAEKLKSSTLNMIPVQARMTFSLTTGTGFDPYFNLGLGMNYAMLTGDVAESSIDLLVSAAIGFSYSHVELNNFSPFLEMGYMRSFEKISGDFFTTGIGVIYRFPAKAGDTEKKQI